jgi:hypothetical protein
VSAARANAEPAACSSAPWPGLLILNYFSARI